MGVMSLLCTILAEPNDLEAEVAELEHVLVEKLNESLIEESARR